MFAAYALVAIFAAYGWAWDVAELEVERGDAIGRGAGSSTPPSDPLEAE